MSAKDPIAEKINRLHSEIETLTMQSRDLLDRALLCAWEAGTLLIEQKTIIRKRMMGRGSWVLWLEENFQGTVRTAQNYMKLVRKTKDIESLKCISLRQAYARLGIATEPKRTHSSRGAGILPPHVSLSNKLLKAIRLKTKRHGHTDALRRDLRVLFETLQEFFN